MNRDEVLALAMTAKASNRSCAALLGIEDESVALAFDMECSATLYEAEIKLENQRFEALIGGATAKVVTEAVTSGMREGSF